jgi:hypothetical protein
MILLQKYRLTPLYAAFKLLKAKVSGNALVCEGIGSVWGASDDCRHGTEDVKKFTSELKLQLLILEIVL